MTLEAIDDPPPGFAALVANDTGDADGLGAIRTSGARLVHAAIAAAAATAFQLGVDVERRRRDREQFGV